MRVDERWLAVASILIVTAACLLCTVAGAREFVTWLAGG